MEVKALSPNISKLLKGASGREIITRLSAPAFKNRAVRKGLLLYIKSQINRGNYSAIVAGNRPPGVKRDVAWAAWALLRSLDRAIEDKRLSHRFAGRLVEVFLNNMVASWADRGEISGFFKNKGEKGPPGFLVISPAKACNLRCPDCYAASGANPEKLSAREFRRIITEAKELWGVRFFVISGGEPFLWRDGDTRFLDVVEENPDCFFMVYTNGTLIDDEVADRLSELANLTPAISLEGFEEETDSRRGKGTYEKVLGAMARLRKRGIPFGISLTATKRNYRLLLSDGFLSEFFERQGATYGWIFQYMPIGRDLDLSLMPSPEERLWMWRRGWDVIRKKGYFLMDFWNQGTVSAGCISGGRHTGYLYIDWNANVYPCVFVPYAGANLREIYARGGTITEAYDSPLFRAIRRWHDAYGYGKTEPNKHKNWLAPCLIRDHFLVLKRLVERHGARPADTVAAELIKKPEHEAFMEEYDRVFSELTQPIWKKEYLGP
ncbi:MAG: radical SAM/SPASM domain-containing protein [candidate division WOR-3 bacterium]